MGRAILATVSLSAADGIGVHPALFEITIEKDIIVSVDQSRLCLQDVCHRVVTADCW